MGKGGGSSGGGGGGSGKVEYPTYMQTQHEAWLTAIAADITTAKSSSPYASANAYNPDTPLSDMLTAIDAVITLATVTVSTAWASYVTAAKNAVGTVILDNTYITNVVAEYSAILQDDLTTVIAKYEGGMRDINAVASSAFTIGEAILQDSKNKQVAKFLDALKMDSVNLRNKVIFEAAGKLMDDNYKILDERRMLAHMKSEAYRIKMAAKKEEADENLRIDLADALWDVELYQHGSNVMAAIGGGVAGTAGSKGPSQFQSALGGAMSGAASGATVGGPWGAVIGGAIGAIGGLMR